MVDLPDEVSRALAARAAAADVSAEALLAGIASERLVPDGEVSPEVRAIINKQLVTYRKVFDRLAQ